MFDAIFLQSSLALDIGIRYTNTDLAIAIAGPAEGNYPNIISDLKFDSIASVSPEINIGYMHSIGQSHTIFGEIGGSSGKILSGTFQDSDYSGDDRTQEFSRSLSKLDREQNSEAHYKLGIKSRWFGHPGHYHSVYVGQSQTKINTHFSEGEVVLPQADSGKEIANLNSSYTVKTQSRNIGVTTEHKLPVGVISAGYEYGNVDYDANANWNLRDDLKHPNSFIQSAEGSSKTVSVSYLIPVTKSVDVSVTYQHTNYDIKNGYDQLNQATGASPISKLKDVQFNSYTVKTGISIRF